MGRSDERWRPATSLAGTSLATKNPLSEWAWKQAMHHARPSAASHPHGTVGAEVLAEPWLRIPLIPPLATTNGTIPALDTSFL